MDHNELLAAAASIAASVAEALDSGHAVGQPAVGVPDVPAGANVHAVDLHDGGRLVLASPTAAADALTAAAAPAVEMLGGGSDAPGLDGVDPDSSVCVPLTVSGAEDVWIVLAVPGEQQPERPTRQMSIGFLRNVGMNVTTELGRANMTVAELLALAPGAVVPLDRAAGSPVDVHVNNTLIARGEVVVVDDKYGVRITEIVTPAEVD